MNSQKLPADLQAAADLVGDIRGLIIFARAHKDISVDSLVKTWIEQAPEHVQAVARAALARESTPGAPVEGAGADLEAHRRALRLVGAIYFYGGFRAETANERALEHDLRALGYWYQSEKECLDAYDAEVRRLRAQGGEAGHQDANQEGK